MISWLLLALVACPKGAPPEPVAPPAPREPVVLHLAAINDFHGALYESEDRDAPGHALGGLPVLVGAVEALRAEHPDLLLLDGGDVFQGSWPVNATRGRGAVEAFRLLGVDAGAVGNHEFDYGPTADGSGHPLRGALEAAAKDAPWSLLAANITDEAGATRSPPGIAPWTIIERSGVRIGVFGLSTTDTPQTTLKKHVEDLRFRDVVEVAKEVIPLLEAQGAEVIIAVGHLAGSCKTTGYIDIPADCTPSGEVGRLIEELPPGAIDVLVVGHAHTLLANRVRDTFVLEARSRGHVINRLDLVVGPEGPRPAESTLHEPWLIRHPILETGCAGDGSYNTEPVPVGQRSVTPSAAAVRLIRDLEAEVGSLCTPVGCATRAMTRTRQEESELGNLMADAMHAVWPEAHLAVTNAGGLRADLPQGVLRREHVQAVMPFDNRLLLVEISGEKLDLLLRIGTSGGHGILQLSGAAVHVDPEQKAGKDLDGDGTVAAWETDRLCAASVGGKALDPAATYRIITTDFLFDGGDHLTLAFADGRVVEEGPLLRDALEGFIAAASKSASAAAAPPAPTTCAGDDQTAVRPEAPRIRMAACPLP